MKVTQGRQAQSEALVFQALSRPSSLSLSLLALTQGLLDDVTQRVRSEALTYKLPPSPDFCAKLDKQFSTVVNYGLLIRVSIDGNKHVTAVKTDAATVQWREDFDVQTELDIIIASITWNKRLAAQSVIDVAMSQGQTAVDSEGNPVGDYDSAEYDKVTSGRHMIIVSHQNKRTLASVNVFSRSEIRTATAKTLHTRIFMAFHLMSTAFLLRLPDTDNKLFKADFVKNLKEEFVKDVQVEHTILTVVMKTDDIIKLNMSTLLKKLET